MVVPTIVGLLLVGACGASNGSGSSTGIGSTTRSSPSTATAAPAQTRARTPSGSSTHTLIVDGRSRDYSVYVPAGGDRAESVPLVVVLHGGGGTVRSTEREAGWYPEADAGGFAVAYPVGLAKSWNAGDCCGMPHRQDIDDVAFISKVVTTIERDVSIDRRRVYLVGYSAGGMIWAFFAAHPAPK